jgi:hypothetical protein
MGEKYMQTGMQQQQLSAHSQQQQGRSRLQCACKLPLLVQVTWSTFRPVTTVVNGLKPRKSRICCCHYVIRHEVLLIYN